MNETPAALVFDYDGVLADTEVLHWKSWATLVGQYGVQFTWDDYCKFGLGIADDQICASFKKQAPILQTVDLMSQNDNRKRMVREWSLAEPPISEETIQMLSGLNGYRIGLVTSSERSDVEPVLRVSGIYAKFDAMVFGDDVTAHKPAPDPYLLVARKLGVTTGVAFEDSAPGIESAQAAGFNVVRIDHPKELAGVVATILRGRTTPGTPARS
jgi:beta-phosphoglucomutase